MGHPAHEGAVKGSTVSLRGKLLMPGIVFEGQSTNAPFWDKACPEGGEVEPVC